MTKIVLIAGGSKGIGLAIGRRLKSLGYRVVGTSRYPVQPQELDIELLPLDVTRQESVDACIQALHQRGDSIEILINSAGYDLYGAAEEAGFTDLQAQMNTNFYGATRMILAVLPQMREKRNGKIINLSSIGGLVSLPYNSAYSASKYALEGFSESLRYELLPFGIYVSLVEPGGVRTETLDTSIVQVENGLPDYKDRREKMARQMYGLSSTGIAIDQVTETVTRIVAEKEPALRYPIGGQARFVPLLKQMIPQRWYEQAILRQFKTFTED